MHPLSTADCNCLALRKAARRITQLYDRCLAPTGLRTSQFSILAKLRLFGPMTINALAEELVMDRTSMGRSVRPLQRERLVDVTVGEDRRVRALRLTPSGLERLAQAAPLWKEAQRTFESDFGAGRAEELRYLLRELVGGDAAEGPVAGPAVRPSIRK